MSYSFKKKQFMLPKLPVKLTNFNEVNDILGNFNKVLNDMIIALGGGQYTEGSVVFVNSNLIFDEDNTNLFWNDTDNKLGIGVNTFTENGGVLQVSNGITFPAIQSACSNANTLDDYEEGIWTPTINNVTVGNGTIVGNYTIIGNRVFVSGSLTFGSTTSITGTIASASMPFTAASAGIINYMILDSGTAFYGAYSAMIFAGTNYVNYPVHRDESIDATHPITWAENDVIVWSGSYKI